MGKSSTKSATKVINLVEADPALVKAMKPFNKGKREKEDDLEIKVIKLKKQKKESENKIKEAPLTSKDASSSDSTDKDSEEVAASSGNTDASTPSQSSVQTIYVEGFGSSLPEDDIKTALSKHFSDCGEITRVFVPTSIVTGAVKGFAYIDLKEDAKKALELNGSIMLGKELVVKTALLMRDSSPGYSGSDRGLGDRFSGRFGRLGGLYVGGRFRGGRCGGLRRCSTC